MEAGICPVWADLCEDAEQLCVLPAQCPAQSTAGGRGARKVTSYWQVLLAVSSGALRKLFSGRPVVNELMRVHKDKKNRKLNHSM